ncbi:hypothetical protein MLD38_034816 [Melastoma candidum]|uniref:Uncharacterized protein n=1 Tax=Melastoma candidum TaxID=119954 RepID=A0ACB9MCK4_9MYRT|nr:hypothetical protein MLD38_034816 [Melastoma candidum]
MKEKKHFLEQPHHLLPPPPPPPPFSPSPSPSPSPAFTSATDGPTVELPRRRRGRPPGSKNKPKPPPSSSTLPISPSPSSSASPNPTTTPLHHHHHPPSMRTLLLQIDPDNDVVDTITRFCRNKSISLSLLSASGTLSHFTLHHPSSPPSALTFRGRFDILSLSATIVSERNPAPTNNHLNNSASAPSSFYLPSGFAVTVSGPQGQVVGGAVGGPLIAAGPVFVVAASFDKPSYHRLPEIEEEEVEGDVSGGGGGVGGGFGCHIGGSGEPEVVWAPVAARPPY